MTVQSGDGRRDADETLEAGLRYRPKQGTPIYNIVRELKSQWNVRTVCQSLSGPTSPPLLLRPTFEYFFLFLFYLFSLKTILLEVASVVDLFSTLCCSALLISPFGFTGGDYRQAYRFSLVNFGSLDTT